MLEKYQNLEVYSQEIKDEIAKPVNYSCFPGAWYYKLVTSKDDWLGIEAIVTLPSFIPDEERFDYVTNIDPNNSLKRYKDTPSVYLGGVSEFENDIGFGWFNGLIDGKISLEKITFRPFWRFIYIDENGKEQNKYLGTNIYQTEYYFFPGDKVKMILACEEENHLSFSIELLEKTKIKKYNNIRLQLNKEPQTLYIKNIITPGVGINKTSFKRVNAIDQYSNEGKPCQDTKAIALNAIWEDMYLYRKIEKKICKIPLIATRYLEMKCPNESCFEISDYDNRQIVTIKPKK